MTTERIKEIQSKTAYPDSISVQQALLQVWNESEQEQLRIADVVCSCCENPDKRYGKFEIILADKQGTDVDVAVDYCENCGHVYNLEEY